MRTLIFLCLVVFAAAKLHHRISKATKLCTFCESFVGGIEEGLEKEEPDMETFANKLCDTLTVNEPLLDPICQSLIDNELESIIHWIETSEKPEHVCTLLHLC